MDLKSPLTEVILSPGYASLGCYDLQGNPQPGSHVEVAEQAYLVLERHHRYLFKAGRYQLHQVTIYVQKFYGSSDRSFINGQWVIGDPTCLFNAHSEILRCAVNPSGTCDRCGHYQPLKNELGWAKGD
jgi:Family of unknown function (DUF6464)